jgi:hypothetical protein
MKSTCTIFSDIPYVALMVSEADLFFFESGCSGIATVGAHLLVSIIYNTEVAIGPSWEKAEESRSVCQDPVTVIPRRSLHASLPRNFFKFFVLHKNSLFHGGALYFFQLLKSSKRNPLWVPAIDTNPGMVYRN